VHALGSAAFRLHCSAHLHALSVLAVDPLADCGLHCMCFGEGCFVWVHSVMAACRVACIRVEWSRSGSLDTKDWRQDLRGSGAVGVMERVDMKGMH
jgi:hypothetical protein